ncbi:hypothetical protein AURDEDRAFT_120409 [Auricularia subglabra TFB-10046 SS5]|nr:hypothetical protein AURDEDRAFT_120409 [Auricularia subglabra TFB-10046 SS5]
MSFPTPRRAPSTYAFARHNVRRAFYSEEIFPTHFFQQPINNQWHAKYSDEEYETADEDSGDDDLDHALARIQACNERLRAYAAPPSAAAIPFPTGPVAHRHRHHHHHHLLHHARAPRDLPAQKPMPSAPLPTPPLPYPCAPRSPGANVHKPLPRAPSFTSTASYVSEQTGAPALGADVGPRRWAQYAEMVADARASTDSLGMRASPSLLYKGAALPAPPARQELPPMPAQKKTRTFGEFLQKAKQAGKRVRKTSLDAYYAATDKAWELRVAAKYAGKDVKQAADTLKRTVSREIQRGSLELRRAVIGPILFAKGSFWVNA